MPRHSFAFPPRHEVFTANRSYAHAGRPRAADRRLLLRAAAVPDGDHLGGDPLCDALAAVPSRAEPSQGARRSRGDIDRPADGGDGGSSFRHRWHHYRGHRLALVAATTVRGVVLGILGTALAQGVLMAIGLWIAGFQAAPLLGLATFFLSPVPVGPPLIWIPAALLLLSEGHTAWAIFIFAWGAVVVSSVDNFVKPMIISRGSALPFVLV